MIWRKKSYSAIYTDHSPLEVILSGMPRRKTTVVKSSMWNIGKPDGWKSYRELTDKAAKDIDKIVADETVGIDEVVKRVDKIETEIKYKAFGKTRVSHNKAKTKTKAGESETNEDLLKRQTKRIEDEILKIKSQKLGRVGAIFKMKEVVNRSKKGGQEQC